MRFRAVLLSLSLLVSAAPVLLAQTAPPVAAPDEVGLSRERLARLDSAAERLIAERAIAGAVVLLARHGQIAHLAAYGHMDVEAKTPMRTDAIFRICSMSKPVTSVAAMILFEEGHFLLDDPVAKFLPEFEKPRVLSATQPAGDGAPATIPAERPITVRDLLTHTSGLGYRFMAPPPIAKLYAEAGVNDGLSECDHDLAENVRRLAAQPLVHQPGERFTYGLNTDVLGRLVEVVAKKPLGSFLDERVFRPLGMTDTGFSVPREKLDRLPKIYRTDRGPALEPLPEGPIAEGPLVFSASYPYRGPRKLESGGGGLVSTASDYARFCEMLASGGELNGVRLLSRKTVEMMASDHLSALEPKADLRFGLGLALAEDRGRSGAILTEGSLGWDGFYTTRFWIDVDEAMIGVILTQTYPYNGGRTLDRLQALAIQAISD